MFNIFAVTKKPTMQVFFFGALFLSVLIVFTATAHSDKGNSSIPGQILDHLPKRKISPLIDKFTIDYQILAKGEQSSLPAQIFEYLTAQLYYSQLELFNSDLKIEEIFRNIFQAVKELFLQNRLVLVNYLLYSSRNEGAKVLQFNKTSLEESGFDSSLDTKILIHGYTVELLNTSIYFDIIDKLLLSGNYNVILVDWTDYNQAPYYCAVGYAYLVGLDLANLIGFLLNNADANAESFHIIGHSLGAQIAGIAGKLTPHLRRITSLDAAAPVFQILPKYLKLAQGDAKFIDTIHTNGQISPSKGFGLLEPYGDKDFYPNGGRKQPGCEDGKVFSDADGRNIIVNAMTEVACHHNRAPKLFLASINNTQCRFLSTLCTSYEDFLNGSCYSSPNKLAEMGLHAKPMDKEGKFYLKTTDQYPYCIPMD